jgi:septal ring factor EnvC (AmiA/AmiB activator)
MSDVVVDKLTQKVANMLEEISEINILVRRQELTRETLNRINERIDAMHTVIGRIENGLKLDDNKLAELDAQIKSLKQTLASLEKSISELTSKVEGINWNTAGQVNDLKVKLDGEFYIQKRWLIILSAIQFVSLMILAFRH